MALAPNRWFSPLLTLLFVAVLSGAEGKAVTPMRLSSPAFGPGRPLPRACSCFGLDQSPPLTIEGVPGAAKSLALVLDDPDAPAGVWVHWVLWNIDPGTTQVAAGSIPAGARQGVNSWGRTGYGGPCPPAGTHRYFFRLYALKERLTLSGSATRKNLDRAMAAKVLAHCELLGLYSSRK